MASLKKNKDSSSGMHCNHVNKKEAAIHGGPLRGTAQKPVPFYAVSYVGYRQNVHMDDTLYNT